MKEIIEKNEQEGFEGRNLSNAELKKISKIYENQIKIPKACTKQHKQQILLCPIGLTGAGKTTVMRPVSKKLCLVRISADEIRKILKRKGFNKTRAGEILEILVIKFLDKKYDVAIDADGISLRAQSFYNKLRKERKINIIQIHIKPPEKFIINKLTNYKHTWLFKDKVDAISNYKKRKILHKKYLSKIDFYYKFDTSKDNLNLQIDKFIKKLKIDLEL